MLAAAAIGFTSCNDSFMERYPDTSLTEQTVFSNYNTSRPMPGDYMEYLQILISCVFPEQTEPMPVPHPIQAIFMQVI